MSLSRFGPDRDALRLYAVEDEIPGSDDRSGARLSSVSIGAQVSQAHPLRVVRAIANEAPEGLLDEFSTPHATTGRPSNQHR